MDWVSDYYKQGLYDKQDLQLFESIGWISADQYKQTTGEDLPSAKA
ncbi:XkdX family protein [Schleiferilactobacillus harbinensis]